MILVTLPTYNAASVLSNSLQSIKSFPVLVVDNASEDHTLALVQEQVPHAHTLTRDEKLGRIASWQAAINTFSTLSYPWMKWLFAGDTLSPSSLKDIQKAIQEYPNAKLIICNYTAVEAKKSWTWRPPGLPKTTLLHPAQSLLLAAEYGNWFGPPLTQCFQRDVLQQHTLCEDLPWSADASFCLHIAAQHPVLYLDVIVGEFHVTHRRHFSTAENSVEAILEESLFRTRAAQQLFKLNSDNRLLQHLLSNIQFDTIKRLVKKREISLFEQVWSRAKRLFTSPMRS